MSRTNQRTLLRRHLRRLRTIISQRTMIPLTISRRHQHSRIHNAMIQQNNLPSLTLHELPPTTRTQSLRQMINTSLNMPIMSLNVHSRHLRQIQTTRRSQNRMTTMTNPNHTRTINISRKLHLHPLNHNSNIRMKRLILLQISQINRVITRTTQTIRIIPHSRMAPTHRSLNIPTRNRTINSHIIQTPIRRRRRKVTLTTIRTQQMISPRLSQLTINTNMNRTLMNTGHNINRRHIISHQRLNQHTITQISPSRNQQLSRTLTSTSRHTTITHSHGQTRTQQLNSPTQTTISQSFPRTSHTNIISQTVRPLKILHPSRTINQTIPIHNSRTLNTTTPISRSRTPIITMRTLSRLLHVHRPTTIQTMRQDTITNQVTNNTITHLLTTSLRHMSIRIQSISHQIQVNSRNSLTTIQQSIRRQTIRLRHNTQRLRTNTRNRILQHTTVSQRHRRIRLTIISRNIPRMSQTTIPSQLTQLTLTTHLRPHHLHLITIRINPSPQRRNSTTTINRPTQLHSTNQRTNRTRHLTTNRQRRMRLQHNITLTLHSRNSITTVKTSLQQTFTQQVPNRLTLHTTITTPRPRINVTLILLSIRTHSQHSSHNTIKHSHQPTSTLSLPQTLSHRKLLNHHKNNRNNNNRYHHSRNLSRQSSPVGKITYVPSTKAIGRAHLQQPQAAGQTEPPVLRYVIRYKAQEPELRLPITLHHEKKAGPTLSDTNFIFSKNQHPAPFHPKTHLTPRPISRHTNNITVTQPYSAPTP